MGEDADPPSGLVRCRADFLECSGAEVGEGGAEVGEDIRGGEGFLRGGAIAEGEFGGVSAEPGGEFCGLEGGFSLGEKCSGDAGEDIAQPPVAMPGWPLGL